MKKFYLPVLIFIIFFASCTDSGIITIDLWEKDSIKAETTLDEIINKFNNENKKIKIIKHSKSIDELKTGIKENKKIDFIRYPSQLIEELSDFKYLMSIEKFFNKEFLNKYINETIATVTYDKKIYGVPDTYGGHMLLYYNKSICWSAPKNTDQLIEVARYLTARQNKVYGLAYYINEPYFLNIWFNAVEPAVIDQNGKININSKGANSVFQFLYDLKNKHSLLPDDLDYYSLDMLFKNSGAAFIINGDWAIDDYRQSLKGSLGISEIPVFSLTGKNSYSWSSSMFYGIAKNAGGKKTGAIKKFINYSSSELMQKEWLKIYRMPVLKSLEKDRQISGDPLLNISMQALLKCKACPSNKSAAFLSKSIRPFLEDLLNDKISPGETAEKAGKYLKNIIEK